MVPLPAWHDVNPGSKGHAKSMSDTTSKHDKDDETAVDSQGPADSDAEDGDDGDDDLDNALFGDDDDDIADAMDVDTAVAPEAVTSKGPHASADAADSAVQLVLDSHQTYSCC